MRSHVTGRFGRRILAVATSAAAVTALTVVGGVAVAAPADAASVRCTVQNVTAMTRPVVSRSGWALTTSIARAGTGDRLRLTGHCAGHFFVDKDLTIVGPAGAGNRPVLSGEAPGGGAVLAVGPVANLTLTDLAITGGTERGLSIGEGATVTASNVRIHHNTTTQVGGGILLGGDLYLVNSWVDHNSGAMGGGGVWSYGNLYASNFSRIYANDGGPADSNGGGGLFNEGYASLDHVQLLYNSPDQINNVSSIDSDCVWSTPVKPTGCGW